MRGSQEMYLYEVQFGCCDGRQGNYMANTIEDIHALINEDKSLRDWEKDVLKYGYFKEFANEDYKTKDYVIDNGFHCMWKVNREEGKVKLIINKLKGIFK